MKQTVWAFGLLATAMVTSSCTPSSFRLHQPASQESQRAPTSTPTDWRFWWGISTSSFQNEDAGPPEENLGFKTDWDLWAETGRLREPRGQATYSYTCIERDIAALKRLGVTHYRFSIEWARVEPSPGRFNEAAIAHYVRLVEDLRRAHITPVVGLWHLTFPSWLSSDSADEHGWLHADALGRWKDYVRRMAEALGPHVRDFIPQNEPNAWALGVLVKYFPLSGRQSYRRYLRTLDVEAEAFCDAARIIREVRPDARIIAVEAIIHWEPDAFDWFNFWYNKALEYNYYHLDKIGDACDWIGINYYFREIATPRARRLQAKRTGENVSDMGWMIDAQGLEAEIAGLAARYRKPILVTENGIPDRTDIKRRRYLVDHVAAVRRAIKAGYDVRGYFHWTLVDNYEWADGYKQKFGLFSMDPQTRALIPKPSARVYRDLIAGTASNAPLEPIPATGVAPLLSAASMPTGGE